MFNIKIHNMLWTGFLWYTYNMKFSPHFGLSVSLRTLVAWMNRAGTADILSRCSRQP